MRILLDTNAYSAMQRGDVLVREIIRRSEAVHLSLFVAGELLYGFRFGGDFEKNADGLDRFLRSPAVTLLPPTLDTARRYGLLSADLRAQGTPIPTNDIWIAAQALETGACLVSFDRHFELVRGLTWIDPSQA